MHLKQRLSVSLLLLRLGVFLVMFMWTLDKFINPIHAAKVFAKFYFINGLNSNLSNIIGVVQLGIILAFLVGVKKRLSYGLVFLMHLVSTLTSYAFYLDPWGSRNLLFFAAWPMLAATITLYLLRDEDKLLSFRESA